MTCWTVYAYHKCGHYEEPLISVEFLINKIRRKVCSSCGEYWAPDNTRKRVSRIVWKGTWGDPLTWYLFEREWKDVTLGR